MTFAQLSPRLRLIADLYLRGLSVSQIALQLHRSRTTVHSQRYNLFRKLNVADRGALAARWLKEEGLS